MGSNPTTLINTGSIAQYDTRSKGDTLQKVIEKYKHLNRIRTRQ